MSILLKLRRLRENVIRAKSWLGSWGDDGVWVNICVGCNSILKHNPTFNS